ncbi:hypothetical protein N327_05946, partial [Fulmarus glacialis]
LVCAFELFSQIPLNIVADSAYVTGMVQCIETAFIREVDNKQLFSLLIQLAQLLRVRRFPYFIMHIRSHTNLPGPLISGHAAADALTLMAVLPCRLEQAKLSHEFFHQNACSLRKQWLTPMPVVAAVNPRGLISNELWQMGVTDVSSFGRLRFVHVSVDTFSGFWVATAHTGEHARDVIKHLLRCLAVLGVPQKKTDSGPAYVSKRLLLFLQAWGVYHVTGIPHSPTGQVIVERAHPSLKLILDKQ